MSAIPASLGLARGNLLIVATGAYSTSHVPTWIEQIRSWYPELNIRVVVTANALTFVTPVRLAVTAGQPIWGPEWPTPQRSIVPHRELSGWADCVVVLPASANAVAKIAAGIADDFAHSIIQSSSCPIVIVPAVPPEAAAGRIFPSNVDRLRGFGFTVLDPAAGRSGKDGNMEVGGPGALTDVMMAIALAVRRTSPVVSTNDSRSSRDAAHKDLSASQPTL